MDPNTALAVGKMAVRWTAQAGVSKIVHGVVSNNVSTITTYQKVSVFVGSFMLSSCIGDRIGEYSDEQVDEAVELYHNAKKWIQENRDKKVVITTESP